MEARLVVAGGHRLGEGPVWDAARGRLYWVDIKGGRLSWFEPASGAAGEIAVGGEVSAVAPRACGEGLLAARRGQIGLLDPQTGRFHSRIALEADLPDNRCNDGNVDQGGRFWFGTMDDRESALCGTLYRLDPDWSLHAVLSGMGIPNTLVCSPDGERLYVADSRDQRIDILEIDPRDGSPAELRPFAHTRGEACAPDGSAVDAQGYLWNAQWGGARLVRYAPDGRVDQIVPLPVDQPTSCAFGGPGLATLYITSARIGLSDALLARQPWAGGLMALDVSVPGLAVPPFAG
jgi:sugar lactone lactonase YvrE